MKIEIDVQCRINSEGSEYGKTLLSSVLGEPDLVEIHVDGKRSTITVEDLESAIAIIRNFVYNQKETSNK